MSGLLQVATIASTPIRVHWATWLLPLAMLGYGVYQGLNTAGLVWLQVFVFATLLCVLLHELGHAYAAKLTGVRVHDIILLPIGGAARLESLPAKSWHEAAVALAGPGVNLIVGLALSPVLYYLPQYEWWPWLNNFNTNSMLASLACFNLVVCAFNLMPAFPLDGGRLARAALCQWMPRLKATRIIAMVARLLALSLFAYAVYEGSFLLGAFAAYVFVAAGREIHTTKIKTFLENTDIGTVALPLMVFSPETCLADVRDHLRRSGQRGAVIADDCSPLGFASQAILAGLEAGHPVGEVELAAVVCYDSQVTLRELSKQFVEHPNSVAVEEINCRPAGFVDLEVLDDSFRAFAKTI